MRKVIDWEATLRVARDISRGSGIPAVIPVTRPEDLPAGVSKMICIVDATGGKVTERIDLWDSDGKPLQSIHFPRKPGASS